MHSGTSTGTGSTRTNLDMRLLQIRAAIALYKKAYGGIPETLEALVPDFLPAAPLDPFCDKPLHYMRTEAGWKLWSVGDDLKDDGGEQSLLEEKGWIGPDFVYTDKVTSNIERRSKGAFTTLPAQQKPPEAEAH